MSEILRQLRVRSTSSHGGSFAEPRIAGDGVFYFFQRGAEFVRCEISGDEPSGYRMVLSEPDGTERSEMFATSEAAHGRWLQIQEQLRNDGWWGPHGRE
jgi:hypothetical protein